MSEGNEFEIGADIDSFNERATVIIDEYFPVDECIECIPDYEEIEAEISE